MIRMPASDPGSQLEAFMTGQIRTDLLLGAECWPVALDSELVRSAQARLKSPPPTQPSRQPSPLQTSQKQTRLQSLSDSKVKNCKLCPLSAHRTQTVFGQGNPSARLVFVGEGPGYEEDRHGLAFVGPAGQLLTKMIVAMGLTRDEVYICNVVKCRPPGNRTPMAEEILACMPFLHEQIAIIEPEMIVALGAPAAKTLLNTADSIGKLRGRFHEYHYADQTRAAAPVPVMPTYHPAYLLRNPDDKRLVWEDLQKVMTRLGLTGPRAT